MLNNLSVGLRMTLGFSVIFLLLLAVSAISIWKITDLSGAASDVVEDKIPKIEMASQILENTLIQARAVRNLVISDDKDFQKKQSDLIQEVVAHNSELIKTIEPMIHSPKGHDLFQNIQTARNTYHDALQALLQLAYFEDWIALFENDPVVFEELRRSVLEAFIENSPLGQRERAYALQREIDWVRQCADEPGEALKKMYRMLFDQLEFLIEAAQHLSAETKVLMSVGG